MMSGPEVTGMNRKQQRRRKRPSVRLHSGKAGFPRMGDDFAVWGVQLLTHVLASDACSTERGSRAGGRVPGHLPAPEPLPVGSLLGFGVSLELGASMLVYQRADMTRQGWSAIKDSR